MTPSPEHTNTPVAEDRLRQVVHRLANLGQLSPLPTVNLTRRAGNDNAKVRYRPSGPVIYFDPGALDHPDELPGQASHELGHVAAPGTIITRHLVEIILAWALIAGAMFVIAIATLSTPILEVSVFIMATAGAAIAVCNPRLQREELAADRYAAELIGAEAVLVWLHAMAERHPPGPEPSWFAARLTTHPTLRRRIAELTTGSASSPHRVQRRRLPGWRKPAGAVVVTRPSARERSEWPFSPGACRWRPRPATATTASTETPFSPGPPSTPSRHPTRVTPG